MIVERQASAIIILALATGIFLSPAVDHQQFFEPVREQLSLDQSPGYFPGHGEDSLQENTHEHALFHIVINGSEKDLTDERFQLQSERVHLENNRSDIVHKHTEGVSWNNFLETINGSVEREEELCLQLYQEKWCGEGEVVLNNQIDADLSNEISQGDNLLIVIETENSSAVIQEYMEKELPESYKPEEHHGRKV